MKVAWTVPALADRHSIYTHIEQQDSSAADAIDDAIIRATQRLQTFPNLGHSGRHIGTHELTIHSSHILVYRIVGQEIQILRVLHTARKRV